MNPRPGEVWLADLGLAAKSRPVIVVSRHDSDPPMTHVMRDVGTFVTLLDNIWFFDVSWRMKMGRGE